MQGRAKDLFKNLKSNTKALFFGALAVLGVLLIVFANLGSNSGGAQESPLVIDEDEYNQRFVEQTEQRLCEIIGAIDGVGEVMVMVTLESGVEYVYAQDQKSSSDENGSNNEGGSYSQKNSNETSVLIVDTGNGKQAIQVKRIEPTILGVAIVCEGGGEIAVQLNVINTVSSVLGLSTNRISVSKMGN